MVFLTQLDERASIKGSRDPLGVQAIWSRFGRHVVGNLTTVSSSVADFTVLLLGHYFAERVAEEGGTEGDVATFLKWEQLVAYARATVREERAFRGTERVWRNLSEGGTVSLGADAESQILGNQKTYGLWGLYTYPAKSSGLLEGEPSRLTPPAREVVEKVYLPMLTVGSRRHGRAVIECLMPSRHLLKVSEDSRDRSLLEAVASVLDKPQGLAAARYRECLLLGGPRDDGPEGTRGLQGLFAELLGTTLDDGDWVKSTASLRALASQAQSRGYVGTDLSERLERLCTCESLIAPAAALFEYVLGRDGGTRASIASELETAWGSVPRTTIDVARTEAIERELRASDSDAASGERWLTLARALNAGDYGRAVDCVLEQNAAVMASRSGSAPWAKFAAAGQGKLEVSYRDEQLPQLPAGQELPNYWRHAYFIDSLRSVAGALRIESPTEGA